MKLIDFQIAARSLAQHKKRSAFLGLAIAAVAGLLVLMNGLTAGIERMTLLAGSTLLTGHVNVGGFFKPSAAAAAPLVLDYDKVLEQVKSEVPELDYWVARGRGYAKAVSDTSSQDIVLAGVDIATEKGMKSVVRLIEGNLDDMSKPGSMLLFESQMKRLGVKVGDSMTLSAPTGKGMYNTADVRVVAIAKDIGVLSSITAYLEQETLRNLYQLKEGSTGAVQLYLKDHRASAKVAARLRTKLADAGYKVMDPDPQPYWMKLMFKVNREDWTGQRLDVTTWEDEMSFMGQSLKLIKALTMLLIVVLSVIIVIGIMNTMWIAIRERTREIGTLRAIGMHRRRVAWMFLLESTMLGLIGSFAGVVISTLIAWGINAAHIAVPEMVSMFLMSDHLNLYVQMGSAVFAVTMLTSITALAAIYPSIRAARLQPVTAMHHIG